MRHSENSSENCKIWSTNRTLYLLINPLVKYMKLMAIDFYDRRLNQNIIL